MYVWSGGNVLRPLTMAGELCCSCQQAAGPLLRKERALQGLVITTMYYTVCFPGIKKQAANRLLFTH